MNKPDNKTPSLLDALITDLIADLPLEAQGWQTAIPFFCLTLSYRSVM